MFSILSSKEQKILHKNYKLVNEIELLRDLAISFSRYEICNFLKELRNSPKESIIANKPKVFAIIREVGRRILKEEHRKCQLLAGLCLTDGYIIEMKTGEGKTLSSTLASTFISLFNKGCHVITVNDYLAKRDCTWMNPIYDYMGISSSFIDESCNIDDRKNAYLKDITYVTSTTAGFDYLKDNMQCTLDRVVQRGLKYCIVDEADSVLIDNARVDYIISGDFKTNKSNEMFFCVELAQKVVSQMEDECFNIEQEYNNFTITDYGFFRIEQLLSNYLQLDFINLYQKDNCFYLHFIEKAIRANKMLKANKDYVVINDKVQIVDHLTGRISKDRKYSFGLHQAIEAKEGVPISKISRTLSCISPTHFFKSYDFLCGMTGTAYNDRNEFLEIYDVDVVRIPTNKPINRVYHNDCLFATKQEKFSHIVSKVKSCQDKNQPVLIGTVSIADSEELSKMLKNERISHCVLNAKNHEEESKIIAEAGKLGAVTISTNMAGRGTDIKLGGSNTSEENKQQVLNTGGLFVIGIERHESRRIDDQLVGRCSRDGDIGECQFIISMEDDIFNKKSLLIKKFNNIFKETFSNGLHGNIVDKVIDNLQDIEESVKFTNRRYLYLYDIIISVSRKRIFDLRRELLFATDYKIMKKFYDISMNFVNNNINSSEIHSASKMQKISQLFGFNIHENDCFNSSVVLEKIILDINEACNTTIFQDKNDLQKFIADYLLYLNDIWIEYMELIESIRITSSLKQIGLEDPLVSFSNSISKAFDQLIISIDSKFVQRILFKYDVLKNEKNEGIIL